jgi:hypothetical protein
VDSVDNPALAKRVAAGPLGLKPVRVREYNNVIRNICGKLRGIQMKIKDNNKYNKEFAFKRSLESMLGSIILIVILLYSGNLLLPINFTDYIWDYYWIILIFLIVSSMKTYVSYKRFLDVTGHIQNIKEYYRFPIAGFKQSIARGESFKLIIDKRIDIYKFLSPIPLLIYGIGIYVDDKLFLQKNTTMFSYTVNYKDGLIYGGFTLFILYVLWLVHLLSKHKRICLETTRYQEALIFYEELLNSTEKTRRLDYRETINSLTNDFERISMKANTSDNTAFTHRG